MFLALSNAHLIGELFEMRLKKSLNEFQGMFLTRRFLTGHVGVIPDILLFQLWLKINSFLN